MHVTDTREADRAPRIIEVLNIAAELQVHARETAWELFAQAARDDLGADVEGFEAAGKLLELADAIEAGFRPAFEWAFDHGVLDGRRAEPGWRERARHRRHP